MKYAVIFTVLGLASVAFAGVGVLTPAEEEDALALWMKVCSDLKIEGSQEGDTKVYCKNAPDVITEVVNHVVTVPGADIGEQVVFIRPPPVNYKHNVQITGGGGTAQKTKIYVLPSKSDHEIVSQYNPGDIATQKPTVYFLKSDGLRYADVPAGLAGYA